MNAVERALRDFLAVRPQDVEIAVIGGVAVSARTEPRFTRDLDFAVTVTGDASAEDYVFQLRQLGYQLSAALEQRSDGRLATVRLRRAGKGPFVDLLFAASGIEPEIVAAAEPIEIVSGLVTKVARIGHLIAMKLVARDDRRRPRRCVASSIRCSRVVMAPGIRRPAPGPIYIQRRSPSRPT